MINGETISDPAFQLTWLSEEKTCQGFPKINGEIWNNWNTYGIFMGYLGGYPGTII
jgi:hypothetical protein